MAINYQFEFKGELLKVISSGKDDNLDDVMNYFQAVVQNAIESGCKKILCDERGLEYTLSTIDTFELAETASKEAARVAKIAIVCNPKYFEDGKFYETVASNRGLIVHVASNYEESLNWLLQ